MLEETQIDCPYCGESITLFLDFSSADASYIEDCSVCCQPMQVSFSLDAQGELEFIEAVQENP